MNSLSFSTPPSFFSIRNIHLKVFTNTNTNFQFMNKLGDMTVGAFEDNIAVSNEAAFLPE